MNIARYVAGIICGSVWVLFIQGCATPPADTSTQATLVNAKEEAPSNLGPVKVTLKFIGIDGQPFGSFPLSDFGKKQVAAGKRNIGIRIFRGPATWNNGSGMYGRTVLTATLKPGRTYRITGRYDDSYLGRYAIVDADSGELASDYVDVEFSLVESKGVLIIPIIIK